MTATTIISSNSLVLKYDTASNRFQVTPIHGDQPRLSGARFGVRCTTRSGGKFVACLGERTAEVQEQTIQDVHGSGRQLTIRGLDPKTGMELTLLVNAYDNQPFLLFRVGITNKRSEDVFVEDLHLLEVDPASGGKVVFQDQKHSLDYFKVGWHDWVYSGLRHGHEKDVDSILLMKPFIKKMLYNPGTPIARQPGEFWGEGWGVLTDQKSAMVAGLVSMADQFGVLHVNCQPGRSALTLMTQADGVPLAPGDTYPSEWGYLQFVDLPLFDPLSDYVQAVARQMKPRLAKTPPPVQWTHWYYYFEHISEQQIHENLEMADQLRNTIPYHVIQLDGGYYSHWGDYTSPNERFPGGLDGLAKRIKAKGMTPGLWLAPFVVDPRSKVAQAHPDWLVKDKKGKPITSGYFYDFYGNALDLTHPGVIEHIHNLMQKLTHEWGYEFIKTDFVYAGALPGIRHNPKMTRAQAFRKGMETIRAAIGEETYLLGCGCPMGAAIGIVDAMRIGPDTAPNWAPFLWNVPWSKPLIKEERSIAALRNNIRHTLNMSSLHRQWWWNDPDCLMVRSENTTLTRDEVTSNASLIGLLGGMLIHSDNLSKLTPEEIQLASLLSPVLATTARPMDLLQNEMAETYVLLMDEASGNWVDVALFNWGSSPADKKLDLEKLGFLEVQEAAVFDFWSQSCQLVNAGVMTFAQIPAHGCKLLRIIGLSGNPALVGDNLHISQGGEISEWKVSPKGLTLKTMDMQRKVDGCLWFWLLEAPWAAVCNGQPVEITSLGSHIYKIRLKFERVGELSVRW